MPSSALAASATWTGGAATSLQASLNENANWSTNSAAFVSGDTITFDNTTPLGSTLVWSAQLGPGFGATDGLHISYTGTGNLTLDGNPSTAFFGIGNITIASGAGVFTLGDGLLGSTLVFRGANNQSTFTNNGTNRAVIAQDILWRAGGGAAKTVVLDGSGEWLVNSALRIDPSQAQSGLTFVKNGPGATQLAAANNFGTSVGGITLNQGVLTISGSGSLGQGGGFAQPIALNSGTFNFASSATQTLSGVISGSAPFHQSAGALTLGGVNTYGGTLTVSGGTLTLSGNGSINSAASVVVNGSTARLTNSTAVAVSAPVSLRSGALSGSGGFSSVVVPSQTGTVVSLGRSGAETLTVGSLTFQGAAELNISKAGDPATASVTVTGALSTTPANGKVKLSSSLPFWTSAQFYNLVQAGSLSGNAASFEIGTVSGLTSRQSATVAVQGNAVGIMINGDSPRWTGMGNAVWDSTSTGNWALILGGGATTFIGGDVVRFDDTAAAGDVSIGASGVQPSTAQFDNNTVDYTLSGPGAITAGGVITSGSGRLTVAVANTYSGGTIVNAGTLVLSGSGTLGQTTANTTVSGGVLDLGGSSQTIATLTMSGTGTVSNGTLHNTSVVGTLTSGTAVVGAALTGAGSVTGSAAGGILALTGANTYTGGTTVNAGTVQLGNAGETGSISPAGTITVASGATFAINRSNSSVQGVDFGVISGAGGFTKSGAGNVTLNAANTYSGTTSLTAGTLEVTNGGALGNSTVNINGFGNRLHLSGGITLPNAINTGGGITVQNTSGDNAILGAFEFGNVGATVTTVTSVAGSLTLAGNLTISNNLNCTTANRTFEFNGAGNTTVLGVIRNASFGQIGLTKSGPGTLVLAGDSDYTRPTLALNGVLRVNGSLMTNTTTGTASAVTVELNGTLGGTGTIDGQVDVYGQLRPAAGGTPGGGRHPRRRAHARQRALPRFVLDHAVRLRWRPRHRRGPPDRRAHLRRRAPLEFRLRNLQRHLPPVRFHGFSVGGV